MAYDKESMLDLKHLADSSRYECFYSTEKIRSDQPYKLLLYANKMPLSGQKLSEMLSEIVDDLPWM